MRQKTFHKFSIVAKDLSGNSTTSDEFIVTIADLDEIKPILDVNVETEINEGEFRLGYITSNESVTWSIDAAQFSSGTCPGVPANRCIAIRLLEAADYENLSSYVLSVSGTDEFNNVGSTGNILIEVVNANDNSPVFTSSSTFTAEENQLSIGTVIATDADSDPLTYSVSGTDASALRIGSSSGVLVFNVAPDYETKGSYSAVVTASDGTNSTDQSIAITITDVDDAAPIITSSIVSSIDEGDSALGSVSADESVTWSINGSGVVVSSTGVVSLTEVADYETLTYSFYITATDASGNESVTETFNVAVNNLNDNAPVFTSSSTFTAEENQVSIGTVIATDADSDSITYSLSGTDASALSIGSSSGVLAFNTAPDYETKSSYSAVVTASDGKNLFDQLITIKIGNLNDNMPAFTSSSTFTAEENQVSIGTVIATDADSDPLTYSLSGTDASALSIGPSSGVLIFNGTPDYETKSSYSAVVTASDGTNSTDQGIAITILDANDSAPIFTSLPTFTLEENQLSIGTVTATDPESDSITYSLSGTDVSALSIGSSSGVLAFNVAPDYETKSSYSAVVTASDGTNSTDQNITITITDVDDTAPVFTSSSTFSAEENQLSIGTVIATDVDSDSSTYSLSGTDASALSISPSSGVLVFNVAPDYETKSSYSAVVTASDALEPTQPIRVSPLRLRILMILPHRCFTSSSLLVRLMEERSSCRIGISDYSRCECVIRL